MFNESLEVSTFRIIGEQIKI